MLHRLSIAPGVWLDARRAVWIEQERVLAVADLHLGFAWAHRAEGNLFPITAPDDTLDRLRTLVAEYRPREVIVLGDIVHRAIGLEPIREELRFLCRLCSEWPETRLQLIAGNHDRALTDLLKECKIALPLVTEVKIGAHVFVHGDRAPWAQPGEGGYLFMGHEHPSLALGDGVASVKCPCFLLRADLVVLPAFSTWAAGSDVRGGRFLSPLANASRFVEAVPILAGKVVRVSL